MWPCTIEACWLAKPVPDWKEKMAASKPSKPKKASAPKVKKEPKEPKAAPVKLSTTMPDDFEPSDVSSDDD